MTKGQARKYLSNTLKTVKVAPNKGNLRNFHSPEKLKGEVVTMCMCSGVETG